MKTFVLIMLVTLSGFGLTACNTVKGAGQDIKSAGESISKSADKVKKKM